MRVVAIKLSLLLLALVPNNNYGLKETRKHTCYKYENLCVCVCVCVCVKLYEVVLVLNMRI